MRKTGLLAVISLALALLLLFHAGVAWAVRFPPKPDRKNFFVDEAGMISAADAEAINKMAGALLKEEDVDRRAAEHFHRFRVRKTEEGTGILTYLSLYERMVRIQGDDAIAAKLSQEDWNGVRDTVIEGVRDGRAADGLEQAILKCGELLEQHFPIRHGDAAELTNELRIID